MKSHYEVLKLEKSCSAKDIREAFIKLSKEFHPDKNKSSEAHKRFVEVNEAYSVLRNSRSRTIYDESLTHGVKPGVRVYRTPSHYKSDFYEFGGHQYSQQFRQNYQRTTSNNSGKHRAVLYCCLLMALGTGLRLMIVYREFKKKEARSREISLMLKEVKERSQRLGREQTILEFEKALLKSKAGKNHGDQ